MLKDKERKERVQKNNVAGMPNEKVLIEAGKKMVDQKRHR